MPINFNSTNTTFVVLAAGSPSDPFGVNIDFAQLVK